VGVLADCLARTLLLAALAVAAPGATEELPKLSPAEAEYQTSPKGMFSCAVCTFFIKPRGCKVVTGEISPNGWCKLFDLPD
jgi:hypothetical protein